MQILALALGYYLTGRLALLMAIPPGYASPVWPAAGLALAGLLQFGYRAWPGIVLGSFWLNFPTALASGSAWSPAAIVAVGVASGAALQALAGALLVRRWVEDPTAFGRIGQVSATLLLGGPVACVVNASIATATLWAAGLLAPADAGFHWLTWWVGDSIGVLVVLPLMLAWSASPAQLSRRNKLIGSVPIAVLLALVTLLFVRTSALEQRRIEDEFAQRSARVAQALDRKFAEYAEVLHAVAGLQSATADDVDRGQFHVLVADMLARHPGLYALSWSPRVTDAQRLAHESAARREGLHGFRIRERDAQGRLVVAGARAEYFPVTYVEPFARNDEALGFDLASDLDRREALAHALDSGQPTASRWIDLVQTDSGHDGVLIVLPAYRPWPAHVTPAKRRQALRGYASAVVRIDDMMALFLRGQDVQHMQLRLEDPAAAPTQRLLYASSPPRVDDRATQARQPANAKVVEQSFRIDVGGRPWRLRLILVPDYVASHRSWVAWSMLVAGMGFTGLFSAFLLMTVGRTAAIRAEVKLRTAELIQANALLEVSINEHARSEDALRVSEAHARSIVDSARDAYIAVDRDSRVLEWNPEAEHIFGWSRAEVVGQKLAELIIPERYRQAHARGIAHYIATGEAPIINQHVELSALHRDGRELPIELIIWPTDNDGRYSFHAFLHDISGRRRAQQRLAAQEAAASALVTAANLASAAPRVLETVCTALGWQVGAMWLVEAGGDALHCCEVWGQDENTMSAFVTITRSTRFPRCVGLPGRIWSSGKPLWIPDVALDNNFPRAPYAAQVGLHAAFGFPIVSSGEVLGVVEFFSASIEQPDEGLLTMMDTLGNLLGQFVARKRAEAALFEEKELAQVTLRSIGDGVVVIDTTGCITYLNPIAEDMTGWRQIEALGRPVGEVLKLVDHQTGEAGLNPMLLALHENRTLGLAVNSELVRRDGFQSPIQDSAAPIHDRNDQVIGSVMVFHDISESRAMALKMSHLAQHDYLTDLPNRVLLQDRFDQSIERARRTGQPLALLYMDLDGFKHINDSLGHETGDLLLKEVAQRLLRSVRGVDTVSRQGGDEFVILLPEIHGNHDAARVAENILQAVRGPFLINGAELHVTLSIGISLSPGDGHDPGALLKYADAAMYQAKQHGRNQYRFYTREISERADRRLLIESSLHQALRNDEFVLHYQPMVEPEDGGITGMEALVRWQQPSAGLTAPAEFIEIAEESGLISRIDLWVLEEACRQNHAWQQAGLMRVPVSVNLSAAHANAERFPGYLAAVLARTGLDPGCLHIEITESQMLRDTGRFATLIRGIKALGVKVAIDDFGTGYSSLGYLCRFPFDVLKIDRTFVSAMETDSKEIAVIEAITYLAHTLGYTVVAEGVETLEQARILQTHGCHEMQGYLYSRPVPALQFEALLRERRIDVNAVRLPI